jgi:hypothetical protein
MAGTLALLVALAAPNGAAQTPAVPPPPPGADTWRGVSKEQSDRESAPAREAIRLRDEEQTRRETERARRLRETLDKDPTALEQPRQLLTRLLQLPGTLKLSADHRILAEAVLQQQRERAAAALQAWVAPAAARTDAAPGGKKSLAAESVALQLSTRVLNETALWWADGEPHPSDAVWIEALRSEALCQGLAATEPAAQMAALIEALPADKRATAWAGEAARLARWGQEQRNVLAPAERNLEDTLVPALQPPVQAKAVATMPAALRSAVQASGWSPATQTPAARCELLRWWSQEQVRLKLLSPRQAMLAWRSALAPRSADYLLPELARGGAKALDKDGFPLVARRLAVTGRVVVQQDMDATGKVLHSFVQRRELHAAGLGNQTPLALEHELDQATLDRVTATPPASPDPSTLRDGVATRRVGIEWVMN